MVRQIVTAEVWCVPSTAHMTCLHQSEDKAVRVFVVFMYCIMNNEDAASFMNGYAQMCD